MTYNSKKTISINIIFSVIQVLVVGIIYLILYKYLIDYLGIKKLGVWSIILATSSVLNLGSFGLSSSLVKFVADYQSTNRMKEISKLIFTSFVFIFLFFIFLILIIYFLSSYLLAFLIEPEFLDLSIRILPISLFCLLLNSLGGIFLSSLEGFQKNYIKNIILIITSVLFLLSTFFLVPKYDLLGVAYAQLIQTFLILFISFFALKKIYRNSIFNKWNWDSIIFKEIFRFGLKFQAITILVLLLEPITKGLISVYGGLTTLGFYEMASKLVYQIRALIVNANQVMIPVIANFNNNNKIKLKNLYKNTLNLTFLIDVVFLLGLLYFIPLISIIWIGSINKIFNISLVVLSISMFINILNGPSYFTYIARGALNEVLFSHILMAVFNIVLGYVFGKIYGGLAVVFSTGLSLIIGSIYLIYKYHKKNDLSFFKCIDKNNLNFLTVNLIVGSLVYYNTTNLIKATNIYWTILINFVVFCIVVLYFILKNKQIKTIIIK